MPEESPARVAGLSAAPAGFLRHPAYGRTSRPGCMVAPPPTVPRREHPPSPRAAGRRRARGLVGPVRRCSSLATQRERSRVAIDDRATVRGPMHLLAGRDRDGSPSRRRGVRRRPHRSGPAGASSRPPATLTLRHPGARPGACDPDAREAAPPGGTTPVPHSRRVEYSAAEFKVRPGRGTQCPADQPALSAARATLVGTRPRTRSIAREDAPKIPRTRAPPARGQHRSVLRDRLPGQAGTRERDPPAPRRARRDQHRSGQRPPETQTPLPVYGWRGRCAGTVTRSRRAEG